MPALARLAILVGVLVVFLLVALHYVPLQAAVVVVYAGLVAALVGLASLIRPIRFLGIRSRRFAAVVALAGAAVLAAGLSWPAATIRASGEHQRLDDFMPAYEFYEVHQTEVAAPPARVASAVRQVGLADMPAAVALMRLRAMAGGHFSAPPPPRVPIVEMFANPRSNFLPLDPDGANEYVGGMAGRPWSGTQPSRVKTPEQFLAFDAPCSVKVAFNMRWRPAGADHTLLTTETRILATDEDARRTFARYWRVIYPGSAIIRRVWLDAIVDRAESSR